MKKENTSKVLMALSMLVFGTIAPFVRNIGVSSGELALYRAIMAAVIVGGFLLFSRQKISIFGIKRELLLLLISGAAMGVNWIFLFEAYKYTTVSVATLSYYFAPVIVMVISTNPTVDIAKQIICFNVSFSLKSSGQITITMTGAK